MPSSVRLLSQLSRRRLLQGAAGAALAAPFLRLHAQGGDSRPLFTLGVASGCPTAEGVVLWTRLAPEPLAGGGMDEAPVPVDWELAEDDRFVRIVARGRAIAVADLAHSVHVEVAGLAPGRDYWYRFTAQGMRSPVGRTRTARALQDAQPLRLAFGSCQQYEQGFYSAYRDMATHDLDAVVHLGDYIYESSWGRHHVRRHEAGLPQDLAGYRNRYALYKGDADLQAAHAAFPWFVTWDDHEVQNDYANDRSPQTPDPAQFMALRAAAYQAWYEHMPVPAWMRPQGVQARIHGRWQMGGMAELFVLDGRQYRSAHPCVPVTGNKGFVDCDERSAASRSYLGAEQEAWLYQGLARAQGRWTLIAQQTLMATAPRSRGEERGYWVDGWDGCAANRERLYGALAARAERNALVLSGDVHCFWAADLQRPGDAAPLATEFVGGSISSQGPSMATVAALQANNPQLRWGRGDVRGYALATLAPAEARVEFRAVDDIRRVDSGVSRLARFVVEHGSPGVHTVAG
ncbi:MAG: alkaline phosphatase D family protein [Pseudacidovorax sp.]|uniref:alkaline phosphatase D family protein n=1 Tax=Pseudacidovorax sp. TaxID=1934311 RepID=UPI001B54CE2E|nr:alkaline phosphatase D family protein [Pseudacidovorax sp.]MBP6898417.1 alkaline phosphatase D family protein [Pseudacidovorax sp.]